jgi:hypothetical protein
MSFPPIKVFQRFFPYVYPVPAIIVFTDKFRLVKPILSNIPPVSATVNHRRIFQFRLHFYPHHFYPHFSTKKLRPDGGRRSRGKTRNRFPHLRQFGA